MDIVDKEYLVELIYNKLLESSITIKEQWLSPKNTNTRHFYIDELLPEDLSQLIYDAFPKDAEGFHKLKSFREKKKTAVNLEEYDQILTDITYAFQDKKIVDLVSELIEFRRIEPDPLLYAGGLSMMFKGDYLNPHLDNSHDSVRSKYRRLNLLYYCSPNWKIENGGNFELWDENRSNPFVIQAKTNRLLVMETHKKSWHSVNKVLVDSPRCCVSNYYFSIDSPDGDNYYHVTSFTGRPQEKIKRILSAVDNGFRNFISQTLKIGRGRKRN